MVYECKDFVEILKGKNQALYEYCCKETKMVVKVLEELNK